MSAISTASNAIIAFALIVLAATGIASWVSRRVREFVVKKMLGGIILLATEEKREEERRHTAEEQRRKRIRQALDDLSDGINRMALEKMGRLSMTGGTDIDTVRHYQAVTVLKSECPELAPYLNFILERLDAKDVEAPNRASVQLIEPLINGTRSILGLSTTSQPPCHDG